MTSIPISSNAWTLISATDCEFQLFNAPCHIYVGAAAPAINAAGFIIQPGDIKSFTSTGGQSLYVKTYPPYVAAFVIVKAS